VSPEDGYLHNYKPLKNQTISTLNKIFSYAQHLPKTLPTLLMILQMLGIISLQGLNQSTGCYMTVVTCGAGSA
jgi:hypothetical protein